MPQFLDSQLPDGTCVLRAEGEVDLAAVDELIERMRDCLSRSHSLELDCQALTFIDSSGLGALVLVSKEAAAENKQFALVNVHSSALRLLQVSGLYDSLVRHEAQP